MKKLFGAALVAMTALALGAPVNQVGASPVLGPDAETVEQARALELQARQLSENHQEYEAASKLYRKAAELYGETVDAADAWAMAGLLSFYADDNRSASDFRQAGERALEFGRVGFAAKAFLDGAWVAHQSGMDRTALELATRGERLAESPLLAHAEREALMSRIQRTAEITEAGAVVKR